MLAPENTVVAFELALRQGADVLEVDVRLSRDGHVIVTHDARVDRTCNGRGAVAELNLTQLKQLDAAYHFTDLQNRRYRHQGICLSTLDEMFEQFPDTRINIDIKDNTPSAARAVARCIERADRHTIVNVGSFHAATLGHFRQCLPCVTTAATQQEVAQLYFRPARVKRVAYEYLQIPASYFGIPLATRRFMAEAKSRGVKVVFWTINAGATMQSLIDRGAHGIVTDRVDLACQLLGRTS